MKKMLLLIFLISCSAESLTTEQTHYREICLTNGDSWMKMPETTDGQITGPSCYGCMPNVKNHLCSLKEYDAYLSQGREEANSLYSPGETSES